MSVEILESPYEQFILIASIANFDMEIASSSIKISKFSFKTLDIKIPKTASDGLYTLKIKSYTLDSSILIFENVTKLHFHAKYVSLFVQTDKVIYGIAQNSKYYS